MSNNTQPLSAVCNVSVSVSPVAAASPTFNQGLIIGPSSIIPAATRLVQYPNLAAMSSAGFTSANPEYVAAQLYFAQTPAPPVLWVGRQDLTATETALAAVIACRAASSAWWGCLVTDAATADHIAIGAFAQAASPAMCYFFTTADAAVLAGTAGNVFLTLQAATYTRTFGIYSTTQSSAAPNNIYAAAAALGVAMGLNTGLANSNFTMKFKVLTGVIAEPVTAAQLTNIEGAGGNCYLNFSNTYNWLEQGVVANGQYLDETLGIDMLASDLQFSIANLLISQPSIPHTNAGEAVLITTVNAALDRGVTRGYIAPGTWNGQTVLNLVPGTPLPKGYLTQSQSFSAQSLGDRAARKAMPIYVSYVEAGSLHALTIGVYVQHG